MFFDYHEWDEIAKGIMKRLTQDTYPQTMEDARVLVRRCLSDESEQMVDNTAESLLYQCRINLRNRGAL